MVILQSKSSCELIFENFCLMHNNAQKSELYAFCIVKSGREMISGNSEFLSDAPQCAPAHQTPKARQAKKTDFQNESSRKLSLKIVSSLP